MAEQEKNNTKKKPKHKAPQEKHTLNTQKQHKDKKKEKVINERNKTKSQESKNTNANKPQEYTILAQDIIFHDPDEEQIKKSYENETQHGRGPPEFNPQDNTYTYSIDRGPDGEHRTQHYHVLKLKPTENEQEILQYHEREDEY